MLILRNVNQINERLNSIFKLSQTFGENDFSFINDYLPEDLLLEKTKETGKIIGKEGGIEELSLLLFQLKDYIPALCNLTNMFLLSKNYDAVYYFTTKLFISHIGVISYVSSGSYSYIERFFDRFIEIVKNCNISPQHYIPFILEIFKSERVGGLTQWKAPALEFMKTFYAENEDWIVKYLESDERKFEMLSLLCMFNTQKGLKLALEYFTTANHEDDRFLELFKQNKKEVLLFVDQNMAGADGQMLSKFAKILLSMEKDADAKRRLEEIFKRSYDRSLRSLISGSIGLTENTSYKNEKQFLFAVRKNIKEPQDEILGLPLDEMNLTFVSGLKCDKACYTFLAQIFKDDSNLLNLSKYASLHEVFEENSLQEFLHCLFNVASVKQDLNANNWAIRMLCLLAGDILEDKLNNYAIMLFDEGKAKEGAYLISCLIASLKVKVFNIIKKLSLQKNQNFLPYKNQLMFAFADYQNIFVDELEDELVGEVYTKQDFELQTKRLFDSFISGRFYTKEYFEKFFLNHPLFNEMAQKLIFGEYRFGRLHNAFVVEGKQIKFIVSNKLEGQDILISIIHPQDCDMRFQACYNHFENPLFNQFEDVLYDVKEFSRSSVVVSVFVGMMINPYTFAGELKKSGFVINKEDSSITFQSFVHYLPNLSLICELELEKTIQLSTPNVTLSNLYFYNANDVTRANGKLITQKQDALGIGSLPYRYFGYALTSIIKAVKASK